MRIRKASGEEMLKLWGYQNEKNASATAQFFSRNIRSGNAVFYTIEHEGKLIGELHVFKELEDHDFADGKTTAYLCAFRVQKEYRGKSLGSRLMKTALDELKREGFTHASIGVNPDEVQNVNLYRHLGFNTKVKDCFLDPCGFNADQTPVIDEVGWILLSKDLSSADESA